MKTSREQLYTGSLVELNTTQGDIKCVVIGFKAGLVALATVDTNISRDLVKAIHDEGNSMHLREIACDDGRTTYLSPSKLKRTGYVGYDDEKMNKMAPDARRCMAPRHKKCSTVKHLGAFKCIRENAQFFTPNRFYWAFSGYNDEECWEDDLWLYDDSGVRHSVSDKFLSVHFEKEYLQDRLLTKDLYHKLQINKYL